MDEKRKDKKRFVRQIRTKSEYEAYMSDLKLTDEQRIIADMVFLNGHDYSFIADTLGYSEVTIKHKMRVILDGLK